MAKTIPGARYVELIHLSDLHFGEGHRFSPEQTPDGAIAAEEGFPTLADVLIPDLLDPANDPPRPTVLGRRAEWHVPPMAKIVCLTGDFTVTASKEQFAQAVGFVNRLRERPPRGVEIATNALFVCPGNHDLDWNAGTNALRWREYAGFLNDIYPTKFDAAKASQFGGLQVCDEAGTLVLSLNSEMAVHNQPKDRTRGDLSQAQLNWVEQMLEQVPTKLRHEYIKIAMVHHHPILLPTLAEPGRGYDAINGAQHLLTRLHRYGFHVILHGHKHHPHTFHEDVRSAFEQTEEHSLVVVAGGSAGSTTGLPDKTGATQTYNRIRIHWSPDQGSTRVQVVTRGLVRHRADGTELLSPQWKWETLATDDRHYLLGRRARATSPTAMRYRQPMPKGDPVHEPRANEYARTRGNFPVAEVKPSLLPGQTNEVHLRIVQHGGGSEERKPGDDPIAVTWSAGYKFPSVRITRNEDPDFNVVFAYYGSALMQAELEFEDGYRCLSFIYAPMLPAPQHSAPRRSTQRRGLTSIRNLK
ncbi:MAG TPA: metallophosphoesterase [Chthoniobacterales bacterium]|nr:metallophosphoesterase [Chthoniobacterales bacterium]